MKIAYVYTVTLTVEIEREDTFEKPGEATIRNRCIDMLLNHEGSRPVIRLIDEVYT